METIACVHIGVLKIGVTKEEKLLIVFKLIQKQRTIREEANNCKKKNHDLHKNGMKPVDIARDLGIGRSTVYKVLKELKNP